MRRSSSFDAFEHAMQALSRRLSAQAPMREAVIARLFRHVGLRLGEFMDAPFKQYGLNETLWTSLVMIYAHPEQRLKPSELSLFMNSSRMNSTRVARQLEADGFIRQVADPNDRRQVLLELMPPGRTFVENQLPLRRPYIGKVLADFSPDEIEQLEHLLRKLLNNLE
jgi:MarR family transcriptional repressor of emrRAB